MMKNKLFVKFIAAFLAAVLIIGSLNRVSVFVEAQDTVVPFTDDFNGTLDNWETVFWKDKADKYIEPSIENKEGRNCFVPAYSGQESGYQHNSITKIKSSCFEGGRPETIKFDLNASRINYHNNASFLAYYDPITNAYTQIDFSFYNSNNQVALDLKTQSYDGITSSPSGSGAFIKSTARDKDWYSVELNYNYKDWTGGKIYITVTLSDSSGQSLVDPKTYTCQSSALNENFEFGFSAMNGTNSTPVVLIDNFYSLTLGDYAALETSQFREKYEIILSKDTGSVSESDIDQITQALNELSTKRYETRQRLTSEKELLNDMYDALKMSDSEFTSDNFDDYTFSEKVWYTDVFSGGSLTSDFQMKNVDGKNVLSAAVGTQRAITTVSDKYWGIGNPEKVTFRIKIDSINNLYNSPYVIAYYDSANQSYAGIRFTGSSDNNDLYLAFVSSSDISFSPGGSQAIVCTGGSFVPSEDGYFTVSYGYNYSKWEDGILYISLNVESDGGFNYSKVFSCKLNNQHTEFFKPGIFNKNCTGELYLDEFSRQGKIVSDKAYIDTFNSKYGEVRNMNAATLTTEQDALLCEALDYWMSMSSTARQKLGIESVFNNLISKTSNVTDFETKYKSVFALDQRTVTPDDEQKINELLDEYDKLTVKEKYLVFSKVSVVKELSDILKSYLPAKKVGDFSAFTEDFENGLGRWESSLLDPVNGDAEFEITEDPDNSSNKVLRAKSKSSFLFPLERFWPENGQMTRISYKIRPQTAESVAYMNTVYSDTDNYDELLWFGGSTTKVIIFGERDNTIYNNGGWVQPNYTIHNDEWYDVVIDLSAQTYDISVLDKEGNMYSRVKIPRLATDDRFVIGYSVQTFIGAVIPCMLYDDIKVEFTRAFWETDEKVETTEVYYDGNTYIGPGETVTISGENIADTVDKVEIYQLPNNKTGDIKYIAEQRFNKLASSGAGDAAWNEAEAQEVEVIQWTDTSLKFIVPESYSDGVYAVKLCSSHTLSVEEISQGVSYDKIIYINNPYINFTISDEGEIATPGGWMTIIGNNLVPSYQKTDVSAVLRDSKGKFTNLEVMEVNDKDAYYVKVAIPDIEYGDYDLLLHNGYGDNTAWSQPYTVKIGASPRDAWPDIVYNVKNYGAVGDCDANDTAAFISAMDDAVEKSGGGVIFVPEGVYKITHTLVIPRDIVLKGEGKSKTRIIFDASTWAYGEIPKALITFTSNVEICDIGFHGSRHLSLVDAPSDGINKNIYLHDLVFQFTEFKGPPSDGVGTSTGVTTNAEIVMKIRAEMQQMIYIFKINGGMLGNYNKTTENLQFENVSYRSDTPGNSRALHAKARYARISQCDFKSFGWTDIDAEQSVLLEDTIFNQDSCIGILGNYYMGNCELSDQLTNNRELFTQDGSNDPSSRAVTFLGDNPSVVGGSPDEVTYGFLQGKVNAGGVIYVCTGQGTGQMRYVISADKKFVQNMNANGKLLFTDATGKYVYADDNKVYRYELTNEVYIGAITSLVASGREMLVVKINEPFAVKPNANSKIITGGRRDGVYNINCLYNNGQGSGCYGSLIDAVYDGCVFKQHTGQQFNLHEGLLWYTSNINGLTTDPFTYYDTKMTIHKYYSASTPNPLLCNMYKGNVLEGGATMAFTFFGKDFVIEGNEFQEGNCAITGVYTNISGNGVILRNNKIDTDVPYDSVLMKAINTDKNSQGSYNIYCMDNLTQVSGDVNLDGKFSLKDVTLVRYYLLGKIDLTQAQLSIADYNGDGTVNLKDVKAMKEKLVTP